MRGRGPGRRRDHCAEAAEVTGERFGDGREPYETINIMSEIHSLRTRAARMTQAEYDRYWIDRVKARCSISESGCWLWTGFLHPVWGYAFTTYRSKSTGVHRKMFELARGLKLTREQYVCHTCDVRHCCNPDHLWLGDNSENQKDASRKGRHPELKITQCPRGHEYTEENTVLVPNRAGSLSRQCRQCGRIRSRRRWYIKQGYTPEQAEQFALEKAGTRRRNRKGMFVPRESV